MKKGFILAVVAICIAVGGMSFNSAHVAEKKLVICIDSADNPPGTPGLFTSQAAATQALALYKKTLPKKAFITEELTTVHPMSGSPSSEWWWTYSICWEVRP